jgi:branched-chain amino acid transport system substrate-binding protein
MISLIKRYDVIAAAAFVFLACFLRMPSSSYAEEFKIGLVIGLTGSTAAWGTQTQNMAKIIQEEINAAGGFRVKGEEVKVVFRYYDSESSPEVGGTVTERAISDGCRIVMAGPQSAVSFASSERCERAKILYVDFASVTDKLGERGFKYYFRVSSPSKVSIRESMKYLLWQEKKTGVKLENVAIFTIDNVSGRVREKEYAELIPKLAPRWNIVESIKYPPKTSDFTIWLNGFKAKKVDILLGDQYPTDAILVTRQTRGINYNPIAIHGDHCGWQDPEYGKNLQWQAIGTTNTCDFSSFAKIPGLKMLNEKYKRRYGTDIANTGGNIACALTLVKDVVERAGSIEVETMRKAMVDTDLTRIGYKEGEWWWIKTYGVKFDASGEDIRASNITTVWTAPDRVEPVYPEEFATTVAPWPKMSWKELEAKYGSQFPLGR